MCVYIYIYIERERVDVSRCTGIVTSFTFICMHTYSYSINRISFRQAIVTSRVNRGLYSLVFIVFIYVFIVYKYVLQPKYMHYHHSVIISHMLSCVTCMYIALSFHYVLSIPYHDSVRQMLLFGKNNTFG